MNFISWKKVKEKILKGWNLILFPFICIYHFVIWLCNKFKFVIVLPVWNLIKKFCFQIRKQIQYLLSVIASFFLFIYLQIKSFFLLLKINNILKYLIGLLTFSSLVLAIVLFVFYNKELISFSQNFPNQQVFLIVSLVVVFLLFLYLFFTYFLIGIWIYLFSGLFLGSVFFVFKLLYINLDIFTFVSVFIFVAFGIMWQIYFFLSLQKSYKQKSSILVVWKSIWKQHLKVCNYYLVIFLFAWIFFLFGGLGSVILGWSGILIERHLFFSLGRMLLALVCTSFLVHVLIFCLLNFLFFYSLNSLFKILIPFLGNFFIFNFFCFSITKVFAKLKHKYLNWMKKEHSSKCPNSCFNSEYCGFSWTRRDYFWKHYKLTWYKNAISSNLYFVILLFLLITVIFVVLTSFNPELFLKNQYTSVWQNKNLVVSPLSNALDSSLYYHYLIWEGQTLGIGETLNDVGINDFRVMPIVLSSGEWSYGLEIYSPLSPEVKQILQLKKFQEVTDWETFTAGTRFDLNWILIIWATLVGVLVLWFTLQFGFEYGFVFLVSYLVKSVFVTILILIFNFGLNGNFLRIIFIFLFLDTLVTFYKYNHFYSKRKNSLVSGEQSYWFIFMKPAKLLNKFFVVVYFLFLILIFTLFNYNWFLLFPLSVILFFLLYIYFQINFSLLTKLGNYKFQLFSKWKKKLFDTYSSANSETVISGLND